MPSAVFERVTMTPGAKRGEVHVTLQGEFGAILEWLGGREKKEARNDDSPVACATGLGVSSKLVAGTCSHFDLLTHGRC